MPTVSISKGKGYARHNDRSLDPKDPEKRSWDPNLSDQNIVYKNESIRDAYDRIFGHALKEYNQAQIKKGRADRQIKNYYEKISRSKQEKTCYELIIQIGSMDDKTDPNKYSKIQKALDAYNRSFQKRNPNLAVFQQITHRDEKGMDHTHIMFIPVSTGNKRGLETKNSMSGALKEMGFGRNGFDQWREHELDTLKEVLRRHELDFELGDGRKEHLNVRQFKEYKKYEALAVEEKERLSELQKSVSQLETRSDALKSTQEDIVAEIDAKTSEKEILDKQIEDLEQKKAALLKNPLSTIREDPRVKRYVNETMDQIEKEKNEPLESDEYVRVISNDRFDDSMVSIKGLSKNKVEMPIEQWNQIKERHNKLIDRYNSLVDVYHDLKKEFHDFVRNKADRMMNMIRKVLKHPYVKEINTAVDWKDRAEKAESKYAQLEDDFNFKIEKARLDTVEKYNDLERKYEELNTNYQNLADNFDDIMTGTARYIHEIDPDPRHPQLLEDYAKTIDIDRKALISALPKKDQIHYKGFSRDRGISR